MYIVIVFVLSPFIFSLISIFFIFGVPNNIINAVNVERNIKGNKDKIVFLSLLSFNVLSFSLFIVSLSLSLNGLEGNLSIFSLGNGSFNCLIIGDSACIFIFLICFFLLFFFLLILYTFNSKNIISNYYDFL